MQGLFPSGMSDQVSTQGDVYSYGVLLLELLTGNRPTDDMFEDGVVLRKFVEMAFPDRILEIVDPQVFLLEKGKGGSSLNRSTASELLQEFLLPMFAIGLWCCRETPSSRPQMTNVVTELHAIRTSYVGLQQFEGDGPEPHS